MKISLRHLIPALLSALLLAALQLLLVQAWTPSTTTTIHQISSSTLSPTGRTSCAQLWSENGRHRVTHLDATVGAETSSCGSSITNRRTWFQQSIATIMMMTTTAAAPAAWAATRPPLPDLLYTILRVREATEQETRLIQSGKFKDVQRANVKLAIRFMVENYRLPDAFVSAAAYLDGNDRRIAAGDIGQAAVQNLVTILEYFDSADVQNLKVGSTAMAGKEGLVLKGLESTKRNIDEFLTYFPSTEVEAAKAKIASENKLNLEEFDPSLGAPINLAPKA